MQGTWRTWCDLQMPEHDSPIDPKEKLEQHTYAVPRNLAISRSDQCRINTKFGKNGLDVQLVIR